MASRKKRWSLNEITSLLTEIDSVRAHGPDLQMEAVGLLREITAPNFEFIANIVREVLALSDPPNKPLQREDTDLWTGLQIAASAKECVQKLCCDEGFTKVQEKAAAAANALPRSTTAKQRHTTKKNMDNYLVKEMSQKHRNTTHIETALWIQWLEKWIRDLVNVTHICIMNLTQSPTVDAEF